MSPTEIASKEKNPRYLINLLKACYFGREMPKAIQDEITCLRALLNNTDRIIYNG